MIEEPVKATVSDAWVPMPLEEALKRYTPEELVGMLNEAILSYRAYRRETVELSDLLTSLNETMPETMVHLGNIHV